MIKYYCDRCGREVNPFNATSITFRIDNGLTREPDREEKMLCKDCFPEFKSYWITPTKETEA